VSFEPKGWKSWGNEPDQVRFALPNSASSDHTQASGRISKRTQKLYCYTFEAGRIRRDTTHRRIAILRTFRNPVLSNMPKVPLHRNELEVLCPV
jgi:hypothetical protein